GVTRPSPARPRGADHAPTDFVRRLCAALAGDARIEGLWLEGDDDSIQWPPFARLDLHFAVPEPELQAVRRQLHELLQQAGPVSDFSQQDAPLQGYAGTALLADGTPLTYRVERTSQIAKVPRRSVNVLLDRSGGLLIPALSFEKR
ncbi:MAG TPA: hypothetical protein VFD43_09110, partial [Planctomycetota bacterium]|nr:hypothetical protein [Planctomycetota bacterium]